jgi:osmoprotectant transport system substrate-binding protein
MRIFRSAALGASVLALIVGACTTGGSSPSPSSQPASSPPAASDSPSPSASGPGLSTTLILGGPPECPERPFCLLGLQETYGLEFAEFKPLDAGGPLTVEALKSDQIDVGLLFTSDPAIVVNEFVLLEDDKQLQLADNLIPVVRQEVLDANPDVAELLNGIMEKLTQEELTELNRQVSVDGTAAAEAAEAWLTEQGILPGAGGSDAGSVIVGSTNFYEQEILGELYAQTLEANGFTVERKFQLGNREIVFPALESGEIEILAEYAATALEFVNEGAGEATTDPQETADALNTRLEEKGLVALDFAEATDQNGFVVTQATADEFGLVTISDLAKPAP